MPGKRTASEWKRHHVNNLKSKLPEKAFKWNQVCKSETGSALDMEVMATAVMRLLPRQPEQTDYSVHFTRRKRKAEVTAKGKRGKISNRRPIFCPLLLVASNLTY